MVLRVMGLDLLYLWIMVLVWVWSEGEWGGSKYVLLVFYAVDQLLLIGRSTPFKSKQRWANGDRGGDEETRGGIHVLDPLPSA